MSLKSKYLKIITNEVAGALKKLGVNDESPVCEIPPSRDMGNFAYPMFKYASILKQNPAQVAIKVKENIKSNPLTEKIEVKGPYLNFFINTTYVAKELFAEIIKDNINYGKQNKKNKKVIVEFSSPNTNKPLHLGHCRNNALGDCISKILDYCGYDVIKLNLINDRGIHICKSMLAYKKFGNNTTPEKEGIKSDHFVGDYYVKYTKELEKDKSLEDKAQELLVLWEKGDKETIELWGKMNKWAIDGIMETYKKMGIEFDTLEYESNNYLYGKEIVELGKTKKVFYTDEDGSTWINNEDIGLDKKIVLRKDGTSVYITQDLGTASKRHEKYGFDEMIYVVGSEQIYHFRTLFETLKKLEFNWADKCRHLAYGMVNLPTGKMKSREGTVVDADDLMDLLYAMSKDVLEEKQKDIEDKEKDEIAKKISLAALKYYLLNFSTTKDVMFIPEKSISFDGNTGPYLQYTTARLNSLFLKSKCDICLDETFINNYKFNPEESDIIVHLLDFNDVIYQTVESLSPVEICNYLYELSRLYNKFYHDHPILKAETEEIINIRLIISKAVHNILKIGINLLGFSPLEKM